MPDFLDTHCAMKAIDPATGEAVPDRGSNTGGSVKLRFIVIPLAVVAGLGCGSGGGGSGGGGPAGPSPSPPPEPETVFEFRGANGDLFAALLLPQISTFRGVIFEAPGSGGDTRAIVDESFDSEGIFDDPVLGPIIRANRARVLALAEKHDLAVLGARLGPFNQFESQDDLPAALARFASESGHPELAGAPIVFNGYSAGGCYAYRFARDRPAGVIGFISQKGGCHIGLGGAVTAVPGLFVIGAADTESRCVNITETFVAGRSDGAVWALAIEPGVGHDRVTDFDLLFNWLDAVIALRLPASGGALASVPEDSGWLGDPETAEVAQFDDYEKEPGQASWLPTAQSAQDWSAFVSPGGQPGCAGTGT